MQNYLHGCNFQILPSAIPAVFFTVFGNLYGRIIPLVHVLMVHRTAVQYRNVFQVIKRNVQRVTHHRLRPTQIICDFEVALHNAVMAEFPAARLSACYFHFCQALWRHVQTAGLTVPYEADPEMKRLIRRVISVGHLPLALVHLNFENLRDQRETRQLMRRYSGLHQFLQYVYNTFVSPAAPFPPLIWNVFQRDMSQRTNNSVESFHRGLNAAVNVRHPNLWMFLRILKDTEGEAMETAVRAEAGEAPPRRKRKWRILEGAIQQRRA
ncbi:hypothetical protein ACOMHN_020568 [Nucella lapillus]